VRWGCVIAGTDCHTLGGRSGHEKKKVVMQMLLLVPLFDKQDNYSFQSATTHRRKFDGKHDDMT
jgi:hypothetical protein